MLFADAINRGFHRYVRTIIFPRLIFAPSLHDYFGLAAQQVANCGNNVAICAAILGSDGEVNFVKKENRRRVEVRCVREGLRLVEISRR